MTANLEIEADSIDDLLSLQREMATEDVLRGTARRQPRSSPETLGAVEVLEVVLNSGGAIAAFAPMVISWLRNRTSNIKVRIRRKDGSELEVSADRLKRADTNQIARLTQQLADFAGDEE